MDSNSTTVPHRYYIFLIIYMAGMGAFGSFVNDMYLPALPQLVKVFGCSVTQIQLSLTAGMIGLGAGEIFFGTMSDKWGRKPILIAALVIFIVAAVATVFCRTLDAFLFTKLMQGVGGSAGYFLARTIPADIFMGRPLVRFMAIIGAINGIAPASAPALGGVLTDTTGWKGIFICLAVIALILLVACRWYKESLPVARRSTKSFWRSFGNYITLLRNYPFMVHTMLKGGALGVLFAYISSAPFIMETHFGYSATAQGLIMGGNAIFLATGSMVALRFRLLKKAGFVGSLLLMGTVAAEAAGLFFVDNFWCYELLLLPMLFSLGMIFTVGNTLAMNEGRECAGAASGLIGVVGYIFGAVVSPLVGMGNIMHSTAWVFLALAVIVLVFGLLTRRLSPDLANGSPQTNS